MFFIYIYLFVVILQDCEETVTTQFLLSDHLFAKAKIDPTDNVYLWLGVSIFSLHFSYSDSDNATF